MNAPETNRDFQRAAFLTAAAKLRQAPPDEGFEVAFAGRSNAGKSSAINALCHQTALARTSKTPGRTQQLVFFRLDDERRLVDLPGYGFAKVSVALKTEWQAQMTSYLEQRRCLRGLVVVMDIRHPLAELDRQMLAWGTAAELPMLALLTKADKLGRGAADKAVLQVRRDLGDAASTRVMAFSATRLTNLTAVQAQLGQWLALPERT